jgi:hypothetical protein
MPDLPSRLDDDQKELDRLKWCYYAYAGIMALVAAATLYTAFNWYSSLFYLPVSLLTVVSIVISAWMNYSCGKAIAKREDDFFTYFVAGMNAMAFPFGTALTWYTWTVMRRPSVRQIYAEGIRPDGGENRTMSKLLDAVQRPASVSKAASSKVDDIAWHDTLAHVDDAEEKLWQEMEAKAKAKDNAGNATAGDAESSNGPIKLVQGDD